MPVHMVKHAVVNRVERWIFLEPMLAQKDAGMVDYRGPDLHENEITVVEVFVIPEGGKSRVTEILHVQVLPFIPPFVLAQEVRQFNA